MGIVVSTKLIPVHISHKKGVQCASALRSCVKVEVAVLGSPSLISLMVSVDVKQH